MIDTVCLLIPKNKMIYLSGVSSWELYSKTDQYEKYVRNPSKAEKETGKYFPRLTGYQRRFSQEANVRLEFSAPKLLFLNNLDELDNNDFSKVIETLQQRLRIMGVIVEKSILENASVSSIHFSKNIPLQNGYTANYLISEMNKVNLRKSFDFAKTRFMNDGQSLYAHTTSHQFVIYDKVADMGKNNKRAIDKDQSLYQRSLFSSLNNNSLSKEIIRFEIRLNHKQKMNKLLEDLGFDKNPRFKDVFNSEMSKFVVRHYWNTFIKDKNLGLFSISQSLKDSLRALFLSDNKLKPKQAIYLLGLYLVGRDEKGMRELRAIISKIANDRTWYRISKDMRLASELVAKNNLRDWVMQIDKKLQNYEVCKINKLKELSTFIN